MADVSRRQSAVSALDPKVRGTYYTSCAEVQDNPNLVTGFAAPGFEEVRNLLEYSIKIGDDIGAGVAAYVDGELTVNLYGGHATESRRRAYDENSLSLVFSCSKPVIHIVIAMFVDKQLLSWDDPVVKYWPEFGVGNKENVTIGDIVRHRGGVGWFDWDISLNDTEDLDRLAVKLAKQEHNWGGERTQSYSGMTGGYYLNEILRRVDPKHRTVGKILMEDVMSRLGTDEWTPEFYYSLSSDLEPRIAPFVGYPKLAFLFRLFMPKWLWTPSEGFGLFGKKASRESVNSIKSGIGACSIESLNTSTALQENSSSSATRSSKKKNKLLRSKSKVDAVGNESDGETEVQKSKSKMKKSKSKTAIEAVETAEEEEISPVFRQMLDKSSVAGKSLNHSTPIKDFPAGYNDRRVRQSEHPSFSGVTNARSLATIASMMAQGGTFNGQTIISEETTRKANEVLSTEYDQCLLTELTLTNGGWAVNSFKGVPGRWQGWSGAGGSLILWEPELKVGFAFVMNAMQLNIMADHRGVRLLKAIMTAVTKLRSQSYPGAELVAPAPPAVAGQTVVVG